MKANWKFQGKARPRPTASPALLWSAPICRRITTAAGRRATKRNSWTAIFRTRYSISPRLIGSEIETPGKAALVYRDFVRQAVRRSVLEWKTFRPELIMAMAAEADIPEADREEVVHYIGNEFRGLHEGNVIRYRLRPEDLTGIIRE